MGRLPCGNGHNTTAALITKRESVILRDGTHFNAFRVTPLIAYLAKDTTLIGFHSPEPHGCFGGPGLISTSPATRSRTGSKKDGQ